MKILSFFPPLLLLISCNNSSDDVKETEIDSSKIADTTYTALSKPDSSYEVVAEHVYYVWDVNAEKKTLRKNPAISITAVHVDSVIKGLNRQYENIFIEKKNIEKGTLNLIIKDSDFLTNQAGTTGAAQYIAQAVINLTAVPGIKFVHIDFKEGSHASPGTWSRKDFPGYIIIQ